MLPSGYLIRPCEGGGSIIHIVDHLNLEVNPWFTSSHKFSDGLNLVNISFPFCQAWSVPEVLRPLYESSKALAQKTTIAVSIHLNLVAMTSQINLFLIYSSY